jgi:ribonuclease HII
MGWIKARLSEGKLTVKMLHDHFGFNHVIGVHLYARTAIAGPICVVALTLPFDHKLNPKPAYQLKWEECMDLNNKIRQKSLMLNLGWVAVDSIERIGMQRAIMQAINTALYGVNEFNPPSIILIDSFIMDPTPNCIRDSKTPVVVIKKGVEISDVLTAANVVARVSRSIVMGMLHKEYADYSWDQNEGFSTPQHLEAIKAFGISPYHRDLSNIKALKGVDVFPNEQWRQRYESSYFGE